MKSSESNCVDTALRQLAADDALEMPDRRLEERLWRTLRSRPARWFELRTVGRWVAALLLCVTIAGLALGAVGGLGALSAWWYSIRVDGQESGGQVTGDGERAHEFVTEDGVQVRVWVGRREIPGGGHGTSVRIQEQGANTLEEEVEEHVEAVNSSTVAPRFPSSHAAGARVLHAWTDSSGRRKTLLLETLPKARSSRLLLHEIDSTDPLPIAQVLETARPIGAGGIVKIEDLGDGALLVELSDGRGWEIAVIVGAGDSQSLTKPEEIVSPSGRVRVQMGD